MLYKKIDNSSGNTITSALNFFETTPTNVSIANSSYREYLTLNPINSTPYHFKIHPITSYIDLSKCYLFTEMRIMRRKSNGTTVVMEAVDEVAPIQMLGGTFIKNIKVSVNGRETFDSNGFFLLLFLNTNVVINTLGLYAYKTYMDTELSYPITVKDSFLSCVGYHRDALDQNHKTGDGWKQRSKSFANSEVVQLMHKLDVDLFNQDLYMISNVEIDIEIVPNDSEFLTIVPPTYVVTPAIGGTAAVTAQNDRQYFVELVNARLYVKTLDLMDGLSLDIARHLDNSPARYGLRKTQLKSLFITEGRTEYANAIFTEEVPRRIIVGLLANEAYNGSRFKSPFKFEHFNVREITINANGRNYPQVPYSLDYGANKYVRPFHDLHEHVGTAYNTESNGINYKMYKAGWCFYAFSLTNSQENEPFFELIKV
jgi:hypothetical protein